MVESLTVNQIVTQLNVCRLIYSYVRNSIRSDTNELAKPRQFLSLEQKRLEIQAGRNNIGKPGRVYLNVSKSTTRMEKAYRSEHVSFIFVKKVS
jgi:hypothetical protein